MLNKNFKILCMLLLLIGAAFIYYYFDPSTNKFFPACPFYKVTELLCPGCGSQRAIHHLLRGDVGAAINSNILLVLFLPLLSFYYGVQTFNYIKPQRSITISFVNNVWFILFLAILFLAYGILRNIPFHGGNLLAPH